MFRNTLFFKTCPCCHTSWATRQAFLDDPDVKIMGYQVNFKILEEGLFLFNHQDCHGTMAVRAGIFRDLYDGPIFEERRTVTEECPRYCLRNTEFRACPVKCECAYVREILVIVQNWHHRN